MLSIIIPIYNEEAFLSSALEKLLFDLKQQDLDPFEIILCENGSTDATRELAQSWTIRDKRIKLHSIDEANYGRALQGGINQSEGEKIACLEIDCCDIDFIRRALQVSNAHPTIVVGSKNLRQSVDGRPALRRLYSRMFHSVLRVVVGFQGTDTHGLKLFDAHIGKAVNAMCVLDKDLFSTEFIIRARRAGHRIIEIPIVINEIRPARTRPTSRIPRALRQLFKLYVSLKESK